MVVIGDEVENIQVLLGLSYGWAGRGIPDREGDERYMNEGK